MADENEETPVETTEEVVEETPVEEEEIETPADDAPEGEEEVPVEEEEEVAAVPTPKKGSFQDRINELTAERKMAERRALQLETQLESTRQELSKLKEPTPEDFSDYKEFVRAAARFEAKREKLELGTAAVVNELQVSQQAYEKFQVERFKEASADHKGFAEKAKQIGQVLTPQTEAYHALFESEKFADIVMAMDPIDAIRIAALSPRAQVREILKLETQVEVGMTKIPTKKVSAAPAPVKRLVSGKTEHSKVPAEKMSMDAYAKMRKEQDRKNRER